MAGAHIEITKDTATPAVRGAITSMQGDGLSLMLFDIGEYLLRSTRDRAASEVAPDGTAWEALSPRYKKYKDRKRPGVSKLRFDFHMLGDQLTYQVDGGDLYVGTNAEYGAVHQFGGEIDIAARSQQAHFNINRKSGVSKFATQRRANFAQWVTLPAYKINIPARPWLGLSAEDEVEIVAIAQDHMRGLFDLRT